MNDACQLIVLELQEPLLRQPLTVKKEDTGRTLRFLLTDNGVPYTISSDCYAVFTAKKPDGDILFNACQIEDNIIRYTFTPQTCADVGELACEVKLYGRDDKLITAPRFTMIVEDTVYCIDDGIESASEVSALTDLVCQTAGLLADVEQKLAANAFADAHSAICYTPQNLTDDQKKQAKTNIAAASGYMRVLTAEDDLDAITDDGVYVYSTASIPANAPFANAAVVAVFGSASSTTQKVQFAFRYGAAGQGKFRALYASSWLAWAEFAGYLPDETYPDCYYRYVNGVKEWVNPPMVPGVEYQTSERRNGKIVYTKYIDLGAFPASGNKSVMYCSGGASSVEYQAFAVYDGKASPLPYINSSGTIGAACTATAYNIMLYAMYDMSARTGYAIVKYTKN